MHFTTESKDDKLKPDDEKTMLPNVVKTMTKTMGCCDMWKLFSVSVEDAPSLEHDDEGWHQSMFEALGLVGVLLKVDPILATCHMDALTSLLWAVRPPESLWEQLEDPALLLTFGVHEATTYLLAWLAHVCFHTDNTRMPEGCPKSDRIPIGAHLEASLVLLGALANPEPDDEAMPQPHDTLRFTSALLVFIFSCLPLSARASFTEQTENGRSLFGEGNKTQLH